MNEEELYPDQSRSLKNLLHMRLMALLRDMIDDQEKVKAAKTLGVNCRTLVRAVESGKLTAWMSAELERQGVRRPGGKRPRRPARSRRRGNRESQGGASAGDTGVGTAAGEGGIRTGRSGLLERPEDG